MTGLLAIRKVYVPRELADAGQSYLREAGMHGFECLVLWAGEIEGDSFFVRQTIMPKQEGRRSAGGLCYFVDGDELFRINQHLYGHRHTIVAQVHSHPSEAYHSEVDDEYAIASAEGSLSLVIPDFAARPFSLDDCAVYRLHAGQEWVAQSSQAVADLIEITE